MTRARVHALIAQRLERVQPQQASFVRIEAIDTPAPGIPAEGRSHLFEKFGPKGSSFSFRIPTAG